MEGSLFQLFVANIGYGDQSGSNFHWITHVRVIHAHGRQKINDPVLPQNYGDHPRSFSSVAPIHITMTACTLVRPLSTPSGFLLSYMPLYEEYRTTPAAI